MSGQVAGAGVPARHDPQLTVAVVVTVGVTAGFSKALLPTIHSPHMA